MRSLPSRTLAGWRLMALCALLVLTASTDARAASGLYLSWGLGYGDFSGTELVTQENPALRGDIPAQGEACCPTGTLATSLRLGFSIKGFAGPEIAVVGSGWNLGSGDEGGAGFVGGGVRIFPIKFLELGGLETKDFPIDVGLGVMFGYAVAGSDFAYTGTAWDFDIAVEYKLASFLSAGVKLDMALPTYDNFAMTSWSGNRGRCLDTDANQVLINPGVIDRNNAGDQCPAGRGPETVFISPQIVFTFHFDLFE